MLVPEERTKRNNCWGVARSTAPGKLSNNFELRQNDSTSADRGQPFAHRFLVRPFFRSGSFRIFHGCMEASTKTRRNTADNQNRRKRLINESIRVAGTDYTRCFFPVYSFPRAASISRLCYRHSAGTFCLFHFFFRGDERKLKWSDRIPSNLDAKSLLERQIGNNFPDWYFV